MRTNKYKGEWGSWKDLKKAYPEAPSDHNIIYAAYDTGDYEGHAMVVFKLRGKLYEHHESHCSCHGLEAWNPEETVLGALWMQKNKQLHDALRAAGYTNEVH